MARGKRINIEKVIEDPVIAKIKSIRIPEMKQKRKAVETSLSQSIRNIVDRAQELYEQGRLEKEKLKQIGLYTLEEAYDELRKGGVNISFRAFAGRVERRTVRSEKIGKKRLIPRPVIEDWIALKGEYYTVKEAYEQLRKSEEINFRAFIGRIEKCSIPSIKIGTQRWVPKEFIEGLIHINRNYYGVADAVRVLNKRGVRIKRNAFERRLDRKRIPHDKISGRRIIAKEVIEELIQKELAKQ